MSRPSLTEQELQDFRARLSEASLRVFMRQGTAGVTLRAVAAELGCSPMTPYRYVADKDELLALGRAAMFALFADSQEAAAAPRSAPLTRLRGLCRAYVSFALAQPEGYRLMFSSTGPETGCAELAEQSARSFRPLLEATRAAVEVGLQHGEPVTLAHLHWATVHGIVSLHLSGKLTHGTSLESLCARVLAQLDPGRSAPSGARAKQGGKR